MLMAPNTPSIDVAKMVLTSSAKNVGWIYVDRESDKTSLVYGGLKNRDDFATLEGLYPSLINEKYNNNLLVIAPLCHFGNTPVYLTDFEDPSGLGCWATYDMKYNLIERLSEYSMLISRSLPPQFWNTKNLCVLGNSRFGYLALTQSSYFVREKMKAFLFLISPVININYLEEFDGVEHEGQLDVPFLNTVNIYASTNRIDNRVGEQHLFNLQRKLVKRSMIIDMREGIGHTNVITSGMIKALQKSCY